MDELLNKPDDLSDINNLEDAEAELKKLRSLARTFKHEVSQIVGCVLCVCVCVV